MVSRSVNGWAAQTQTFSVVIEGCGGTLKRITFSPVYSNALLRDVNRPLTVWTSWTSIQEPMRTINGERGGVGLLIVFSAGGKDAKARTSSATRKHCGGTSKKSIFSAMHLNAPLQGVEGGLVVETSGMNIREPIAPMTSEKANDAFHANLHAEPWKDYFQGFFFGLRFMTPCIFQFCLPVFGALLEIKRVYSSFVVSYFPLLLRLLIFRCVFHVPFSNVQWQFLTHLSPIIPVKFEGFMES